MWVCGRDDWTCQPSLSVTIGKIGGKDSPATPRCGGPQPSAIIGNFSNMILPRRHRPSSANMRHGADSLLARTFVQHLKCVVSEIDSISGARQAGHRLGSVMETHFFEFAWVQFRRELFHNAEYSPGQPA